MSRATDTHTNALTSAAGHTSEGRRNPGRAAWITVQGARTNNLRDVSVRIPKHRLTVFTGVSGSGKSSLAFGTIAAEAQRLVADSYPLFVRNRLPSSGHAEVDHIDGLTFTTVVDQRPFTGNARSTVGTASDLAPLLRMMFSRIGRPNAGYSPAYSFNDPSGMCPRCEGLGTVDDVDLDRLLDLSRSLNDGAVRFPTFAPGTYRWKRLVHSGLVDPDVPLERLPGDPLENPDPEYPKSRTFDGIMVRLRDGYLRRSRSHLTDAEREGLARVVTRRSCPDCGGTRLNEAARGSRIDGRSIADWSALPISELRSVVAGTQDARIGPVIRAIGERLHALEDVGLGYLTPDRRSTTLSGGEAQRVKLVRHLGSALSDVCFVLDEPSAGLHPHDVHRLLRLLARLRDAGNTVLVVEHHPAVITAADHVVELGPGAGADGGTLVFEGSPSALLTAGATGTATSRMLRTPVRINEHPREPHGWLRIEDARDHNLRHVTVEVPLGVLTAVSGVAGSGKSTLFAEVLPDRHPEFTVIGQGPLAGGSRSVPATVLGIAEPIRRLFGTVNGISPSWFSPNAKGACPECKGKGVIVTDLAFMDDVDTPCEACGGTRFNRAALGARFQGHSIAEVLAMNAERAAALFAEEPPSAGGPGRSASGGSGASDIGRRLRWLADVGLGYLGIGQATSTLSGGERQRLLLAKHLAEAGAGSGGSRPLPGLRLVLDEPTAGLHGEDTDRLLALLDRLVDAGASVVVIEHDLRVIAHADHVIDIGPGAGHEGGTVIHEGPPEGLLTCEESVTGRYLRKAIGR
jgi:excinuclease UvrABC ATPase subunit